MNVAFIIPSITAGGAERVVVRLANYIASVGNTVFIYCSHAPDIDYGVDDAVTVRVLENLDAETILAFAAQDKLDVISDHYHWNLRHLLEIERVANAGVPVVLSEHNSFFYPLFQSAAESNRESLEIYHRRKDIYKAFTAITTLTRFSAALLEADGIDNVVLMYNPVSFDNDKLSPLTHQRILNVSSFVKPAKRIDLMFEAFGRIKAEQSRAVLRVVGEIDYERYSAYCRSEGIIPSAVEVIGISSDVSKHYLASSVFTMTSEIEGQPMVLLEAASHGIPQVVYDIPGIEDQILHGETGYIIPRGDVDGFAEAVIGLLRDQKLRKRLGLNSREFVLDRFGFDTIGQRWMQLLGDVVNDGRVSDPLRWSNNQDRPPELSGKMLSELNHWMKRISNPVLKPLISVIVPVYGTEEQLSRCLESLTGQTMSQIEIIVVNDASPGDTRTIVDSFAQTDKRIVYLEHQENKGLYQARSTGARVARGTFLAHVDSDDFVHPDFLRRLYQAAVIGNYDIVECAAMEVRQNGERLKVGRDGDMELVQPDLSRAFIQEEIRHVVWNKLYRKSLWDSAPMHMDVRETFSITEDLLRNTPLFTSAERYKYIDIPLYFYVRRESSVVTEGDFPKMLGKLDQVAFVYDSVCRMLAYSEFSDDDVVKMRTRQMTDFVWYISNGFNAQEGLKPEDIMAAFDKFGIFGAVAAKQSEQIGWLKRTENAYWTLVEERAALLDRLSGLEAAVESSEKGREWEKERADYFENLSHGEAGSY